MSVRERIEAALLQPGSPFELTEELVLGEAMQVFRTRARSMRELFERSRAFGEQEYLVFGARRLSYVEHARQVSSLAHALRERFGVEKGDRVALLAANCPEWVIAFWAATAIGALPVGLNGWWQRSELEAALQDTEPRVLIVDRKRRERLPELPDSIVVLAMEELEPLLQAGPFDYLPEAEIDEDDPAALLFSSGTTGRAKGIVASHRGIIALVGIQLFHGARAALIERELGVPEGPRDGAGLVSTPLFHVSGLYAGVVTRLAAGARTVWTTGRFDAGEVLDLIERERVTGWGPTTTMVRRVIAHPSIGERDLGSMRYVGLGGSPIPTTLIEQARAWFTNARVATAVGYGQTECGALATIAFGEELDLDPGTVGRPLPTVQVEIRDEHGVTVPEGAVGEICVRSPLVMLEYFRRPEATRERFWPGRWLRTGDLGRLNEGRLHIEARRDDLIIRGGENLYPFEIEQQLERHALIDEAVVFGLDDEELGQIPAAVLVSQHELDIEAIRTWLAEELAYFKVPVHLLVQREALPRNAAGKVLRFQVREAFLHAAEPDAP